MDELEFIKNFIKESDLSVDIVRSQLRCLWTAYCLHEDYWVDTSSYDWTLVSIWEIVKENKTNYWNDFDTFDYFMCGWQV